MKAVFKLVGTQRFLSNIKKIEKKVPDASRMAMFMATELLRGYIVKYKLSGQLLKVRSNLLRSSITKEVIGKGFNIIGRVGSNVKYARIHELGGPQKPITIVPVRAKALRFYIGGEKIIVRSVTIPAFAIKAKYYIKSSMRETAKRLRQVIGRKVYMELKD